MPKLKPIEEPIEEPIETPYKVSKEVIKDGYSYIIYYWSDGSITKEKI